MAGQNLFIFSQVLLYVTTAHNCLIDILYYLALYYVFELLHDCTVAYLLYFYLHCRENTFVTFLISSLFALFTLKLPSKKFEYKPNSKHKL